MHQEHKGEFFVLPMHPRSPTLFWDRHLLGARHPIGPIRAVSQRALQPPTGGHSRRVCSPTVSSIPETHMYNEQLHDAPTSGAAPDEKHVLIETHRGARPLQRPHAEQSVSLGVRRPHCRGSDCVRVDSPPAQRAAVSQGPTLQMAAAAQQKVTVAGCARSGYACSFRSRPTIAHPSASHFFILPLPGQRFLISADLVYFTFPFGTTADLVFHFRNDG